MPGRGSQPDQHQRDQRHRSASSSQCRSRATALASTGRCEESEQPNATSKRPAHGSLLGGHPAHRQPTAEPGEQGGEVQRLQQVAQAIGHGAMLRARARRGNAAGAESDFRQVEAMTAGTARRVRRARRLCRTAIGTGARHDRLPDPRAAHVADGAVALVTFWSAALLRKGSPLHRRAGQVYLLAMLGMVVTGVPMAMTRAARRPSGDGGVPGLPAGDHRDRRVERWRAIRDKRDVGRATPARCTWAWPCCRWLSGIAVLALGIRSARRC